MWRRKMKPKTCQLCEKEVYSGMGEGCKLCGMILESKEKFCSTNCERTYVNVKKIKFI